MIDRKHIGFELPAVCWPVERGRLLAFAKAIGEQRPEYVDEACARAAGFRGLLAPPTFLFSAGLDTGALDAILNVLEVPISAILHGEQSFTYLAQVFAGDVLSVKTGIADIAAKKGGAMEVITQRTTATNQLGELVAETTSVIVARSSK